MPKRKTVSQLQKKEAWVCSPKGRVTENAAKLGTNTKASAESGDTPQLENAVVTTRVQSLEPTSKARCGRQHLHPRTPQSRREAETERALELTGQLLPWNAWRQKQERPCFNREKVSTDS